MIPTAAWLERYVFEVRPTHDVDEHVRHVVQVIRAGAGAEVYVSGVEIAAELWEPVGQWEVANVELADGVHTIESAEPVGAVLHGYVAENQGSYTNGAGFACALGLRGDPSDATP